MLIDKEVKKRITKLKEVINEHRYLYHVLNQQKISENALDSLKKELFDLEQQYPQFITLDSPTQRVAGQLLKEFQKVAHYKKMYSLNDAFTQEDMQDWEKRLLRFLKRDKISWTYFCELKVDGLAVELIYENGILIQGSTRGDGIVGEDVTQNLKTIESIPLKIDNGDKTNKIIVYGEVFVSNSEFEKINKEQKKRGLEIYSNPRNLAAGSIRQLDPKITAERKLSFIAYDVDENINLKTHNEKHLYLKKLGFGGQTTDKMCQNLKEVFDFYQYCNQNREKLEYKIDGVVVLVNENNIFQELGVTGKSTRGSIAYKFPLKETTTKVKNIIVQIGRTGLLTPVAELEPVQIDGVTISRATLHNQNEIKRLSLKIGDTVIVGRAGDVVPDIIKVLSELRQGDEKKFLFPKFCPCCNSLLEERGPERLVYCPNQKCFDIIRRNLSHFVSKQGFDIKGCGPKIIDKLLKANLINNAADIFNLQIGDIINLEGFSDLSSQNLIKSIEKSKKIPFHKFIYALGIHGVGEQMALTLSKEFTKIEELEKTNFERLKEIKDIGPIVAQSIIDWFSNDCNKIILDKLKDIVEIKYTTKNQSQKLLGKKFLFTGTLNIKRDKAKEMIIEAGGEVISDVSSDLDYLVVGENPGSKLIKAEKIATIKIINEKQFLEMVKNLKSDYDL